MKDAVWGGVLMKLTRRGVLGGLAMATVSAAAGRVFGQERGGLQDPQRPGFHLLPERGWMNDPCGPMYFRGVYHMFFQYNPHAAVWGDMHWGHAMSPDMVHWTRLPVALAPTPGGPDAEGCFTGSAILHQGKPTLLYTGIKRVARAEATLSDGNNNFRESQCLAEALDDSLRSWRKVGAPVISAPPEGMLVTGFRDPAPFQVDGRWFTVVGSGVPKVGGNVLLYRAADEELTRWEYLHPLTQGAWAGKEGANPVDTGEMWECPDFFPLGDEGEWVLIHSTEGKTLWQSGRLDRKTMIFHPKRAGELDYGRDGGRGTFYAPKTQLDAHGGRILWGWLPETRPEGEYARAGWAGMMSLPRRLSLVGGALRMDPAAEVARLRGAENAKANVFPGGQQEFGCEVRAGGEGKYVISDEAGPLVEMVSNPGQDSRTLRLSGRSAADPDVVVSMGENLPDAWGLKVFLDNSVLEMFLEGRVCATRRFYQRERGRPVATLTVARPFEVVRPQSWTVGSIWRQ